MGEFSQEEAQPMEMGFCIKLKQSQVICLTDMAPFKTEKEPDKSTKQRAKRRRGGRGIK